MIKKFESFNKMTPIITKDSLLNYYYCTNCHKLWKEFDKEYDDECPYCGNKTAEKIDSDLWYEKMKEKNPDYEDDLEKEKSDGLIDMISYGISKERKDR